MEYSKIIQYLIIDVDTNDTDDDTDNNTQIMIQMMI